MEQNQDLLSLIEDDREKFYRVAFAYVKNREDALDILHNAIVKGLQGYHLLRKKEVLRTWFYRILINESITLCRRRKRTVSFDQLTEGELPAQREPERAHYIDLYAEIDRLPPKLKTILILRYFEDMKIRTIAEIMAMKQSTVKSRLYRALNLLRIRLEDVEHD